MAVAAVVVAAVAVQQNEGWATLTRNWPERANGWAEKQTPLRECLGGSAERGHTVPVFLLFAFCFLFYYRQPIALPFHLFYIGHPFS